MAKQRTAHAYEIELKKMIKARKGKEDWLIPQIRATANNMVLLDKIQEELSNSNSLVSLVVGSQGQTKTEVNPLLDYYNKLQRTLMAQFQALGLNWNATPSKMTENTKDGGSEQEELKAYLEKLSNI